MPNNPIEKPEQLAKQQHIGAKHLLEYKGSNAWIGGPMKGTYEIYYKQLTVRELKNQGSKDLNALASDLRAKQQKVDDRLRSLLANGSVDDRTKKASQIAATKEKVALCDAYETDKAKILQTYSRKIGRIRSTVSPSDHHLLDV